MKKISKALLVLVLFASVAVATPTEAPDRFVWDDPVTYNDKDKTPLPAQNIFSHKIYWTDIAGGVQSNANSMDVGNVNMVLFADLPIDVFGKHFTLTTITTDGIEGGYSKEVRVDPFKSAGAPQGFRAE